MMIVRETISNILCRILIGHRFSGYELKKYNNGEPMQVLPDKFYCGRCKKICSIDEGWV